MICEHFEVVGQFSVYRQREACRRKINRDCCCLKLSLLCLLRENGEEDDDEDDDGIVDSIATVDMKDSVGWISSGTLELTHAGDDGMEEEAGEATQAVGLELE